MQRHSCQLGKQEPEPMQLDFHCGRRGPGRFSARHSSCHFFVYFDGDAVGDGPGGLCGIEAIDALCGSGDMSAVEPNGNSNPAACFTNSISEAVLGGCAGFAAVAT